MASGVFLALIKHKEFVPGNYYIPFGKQTEVVQYLRKSEVMPGQLIHLSGAWYQHSYDYLHRLVVNGWDAKVTKGGEHWQAEFFIPLSSIDAPYELPYWRANFARQRPARPNAPEETSAWVNPGISLHNYKRFGYLTMPRFVPAAPGDIERFTTSPVEVVTTRTTSVTRE